MIIGLWHPGSGLGDQLFCYLAARITAKRLGVKFLMLGDFKGKDFLSPLLCYDVPPVPSHVEYPAGKIIVDNNWPIYEGKAYYDPEFDFIEDNTIVDGCRIQDERYWEGYPLDIWLKTEPLEMPDDLCVIGFRGGEYATVPDLMLPPDYYNRAILELGYRYNHNLKFKVVTDDVELAKQYFPTCKDITHDMATDWREIRHAKHLIISNSAFYILPSLLNEDVKEVKAPRYWARHNIKEWSTPQNYYKKFTYL